MSSVSVDAPAAPRGGRWPLISVLALALALRLLEARGVHLWFDEIYVVLVARRSVPDIVRVANADIHPPLYFLVQHLWQVIGGQGDRWLKLLPIGLALVSIAFTEALGRRAVSPRAGFLAALFCALGPPLIVLSQTVNVQAMMWALVSLMAWAAWRVAAEHERRHEIVLALVALVAIYTQYLAIPAAVAVALWGGVVLRRDRRALVRWVALWLVVAVAYLPQVPAMVAQFHRESDARYFRFPDARGLFGLARAIGFGSYAAPVLLALAAIPALADRRRRAVVALLVLLVALMVPSTRIWAYVLTRDMLAVAPLVYLLVAAGIDRLPGRVAPAAVSLLLLAFAARELSHHRRFAEPLQLARAEAVLDRAAGPGDLIVHAETHSLLYFRFYQPGRRHLLLAEQGSRVPYFDGGLAVPDTATITPAAFAAARDSGVAWWGVRVDRALATRGRTYRAGEGAAAVFDSLARGRTRDFPPVRLWQGSPALVSKTAGRAP